MKKITKIFLFPILILISLVTMNCDDIGSFTLNMPFSDTVTISGSDSYIYETYTYCLEDLEEWDENRDQIERIEYLKAALWVVSFSPSDLRGTVTATLTYDGDGTVLFSETLPSNNPNDYLGEDAYVFELTSDEISTYNAILSEALSSDGPTCFTGTLEVSGITGSPPYNLVFFVEIIHEVDVTGD